MKIINVDGGIGRVITSLPSLLKYHKNNPEEEWYLAIPGWDYVSFGIPELDERTFNPETKGVWESYYLKADEIVNPEPYQLPNFYKGKISLAEAFDEIINETEDHSDLEYEALSISNAETRRGQKLFFIYEKWEKHQTIVINPYGSTTGISCRGL